MSIPDNNADRSVSPHDATRRVVIRTAQTQSGAGTDSFVTRTIDRLMGNAARALALLIVLAVVIIAIPFVVGGVIVIVVAVGVLLLTLYIRLWIAARKRARAGVGDLSPTDVPVSEGDVRQNVRVRAPSETQSTGAATSNSTGAGETSEP